MAKVPALLMVMIEEALVVLGIDGGRGGGVGGGAGMIGGVAEEVLVEVLVGVLCVCWRGAGGGVGGSVCCSGRRYCGLHFPSMTRSLLLEPFLHKASAPCHLTLSFLPRVTHLFCFWLRVSHAVAGGGGEGAFMVSRDPGWSLA